MKLHEVLEPTAIHLDEGTLRNAIAAAGFALATIPAALLLHQPDSRMSDAARTAVGKVQQQRTIDPTEYVAIAAAKYHVDKTIVRAAVDAALKYQHSDFPSAKDILAVVGTESSFDPEAASALANDPARGLMQVRPGTWNLPPESMSTIDSQIKTGATILRKYYVKLGSREAALHAYNVGLRNHNTGKVKNPRYVPKVNKERDLYRDL
jgi:hypothetical protein